MGAWPWFAVYVKPRHEKNVAAVLSGKGYEVFLPLYTKRAKYGKKFELPLFPSYLFCRVERLKTNHIMTIDGVFSIVGSGGIPQAIPEEDIQRTRTLVESRLMAMPWPYVSEGQQIYLDYGPLQGVQGLVVDASNEKWLVVSIDMLQRSIAVKLERESLPVKGFTVRAQPPTFRPERGIRSR